MEFFKGEWLHVLIVKTSLSLDPESGRYNQTDITTLLSDITAAVKTRKSGYHKIKLEEIEAE